MWNSGQNITRVFTHTKRGMDRKQTGEKCLKKMREREKERERERERERVGKRQQESLERIIAINYRKRLRCSGRRRRG